jgi:hypothetical protein
MQSVFGEMQIELLDAIYTNFIFQSAKRRF